MEFCLKVVRLGTRNTYDLSSPLLVVRGGMCCSEVVTDCTSRNFCVVLYLVKS